MDKLRLRFAKTGRAIYISHLDLMHTLQRGFSRAGYALAHSEGFNPHPVMSIALPLSVGTSSVCEVLDFRLKDEADCTELPARLTAALPEGIEILEVYEPQRKAAELKWLKVEGRLEYDRVPSEQACAFLREFFAQESIVIQKKGKNGLSDFDLIPGIREITFTPGEGRADVAMIISAQQPTFNPDLIAEALRQKAPEWTPDFTAYRRLETYNENMEIFR